MHVVSAGAIMMSVVPMGYKQTEVGVIPEDWNAVNLGSLTVLMTNGFVGTVTRHYADNDNGVLYIQGYNVEENSFNFHGIKYVNHYFHKAHAKSCLRGGDLLTVQTGDVGLTTMVPESLAGSNCHALIISRFDKKAASSGFFSYYLNSSPGRSRLRLIETGTTMKHLNVGDMLEFLVPLPPTKAEQEAIAEALSDTDALIESLEQLITKKRYLKQGAMQELLTGKKRLPGFSGEWEVKRLGEVVRLMNGFAFKSCTYTPLGEYNVVTIANVQDGFMDLEKCNKICEIPDELQSHQKLQRGDILISMTGNVGRVCRVSEDDCLLNQRVGKLVSLGINDAFIFHILGQRSFVVDMTVKATGGAQGNLSVGDITEYQIRMPSSHSEQTAIAAILSDMDAEITALETKLAKTRQLKQGMMHNLLTGKIRLV